MGVLAELFLPFPWPLTARQDVYLFGMQGLTAMCVDFGANFGIAYVYHNQKHVKMWVFAENTIAGDLGVTPLIQCAVSFLITSTLVHSDLHHRAVRPLAFVYPHVEHLPDPAGFFDSLRRKGRAKPPAPATTEASTSSASSALSSASTAVASPSDAAASASGPKPSSDVTKYPSPTSTTLPARSLYFYLLMFLRFTFEGTEHNMLLTRSLSFKTRLGRFGWTILQGLAIGVVFGLPFWCLAVVILGPIYGTGDMGDVWAPQAIKGVYGGLLGLVTNPVIAALALGSQAEHHLIPLTVDEKTAAAAAEEKTTTGVVSDASSANPLAPPPKAARRGSVASSSGTSRRRPSITANPSTMAVLPVGATATPRSFAAFSPPSAALAPTAVDSSLPAPSRSPARPPNRPRAGTAASEYSLGGTGGRAQRLRANSRASVLSIGGAADRPAATAAAGAAPSAVLLGPPIVASEGATSSSTAAAASRARAASSASASSLPSTLTDGGVPPTTGPGAGAVHRLRQAAALETPRESLELRENERSAAAAAAGDVGK